MVFILVLVNHLRLFSMKFIFCSSLFIAILSSSSLFSQPQFGFRGGLNLNDIASFYVVGFDEPSTEFRVGYHVGIVSKLKLSEKVNLQPSLLFTSKGYKSNESTYFNLVFGAESQTSITNYIELPVEFQYTFSEQIFAFIGPYIAYGIGGKLKTVSGGQETETNYLFESASIINPPSNGEVLIRNLDFGLNFGLGYQLNRSVAISIGHQLGLSNRNVSILSSFMPQNANAFEEYNRIFFLSLTYFVN